LTLAREDSNQDARMLPVDLAEIARQAVGDFSLQAEQSQIDLGLIITPADSAATSFVIDGESAALAIMLSNLIANAINHVPIGGHIDVRLQANDTQVVLEVLDDGPGIAQAELGRVLDRFFRGEHTRSVGSGLGLAIANRIAQKHGATLTLGNRCDGQSGLSAGVTFTRIV